MEIISNFGLNPVLLGAQIVNFLIILFVLKKLLYKPILDVLKKRQNTIREGLGHAEEARIKLEKVLIEEKHILRNAQLQSKKIIEDAKQELAVITRQMNDEAKTQTEKLLNNTREQIAKESIESEKRLAVKSVELAVALLKKSLKDFFTPKEQEAVISNALRKIKNID